ncbi:MAG: DUF5110 domain-containing protein, partial [Phycisphaerales bacterium]|nr:DUF5110 domain-containing protein [Phycisphaerales bacterium]
GDHRHPVHFSGDAHTGWAMLAFQVPFTITAGNVGCFFWSHDIGGHFGPRFEEATARWVQFGALSPVLRLHSARTASLDRRPWTYEQRFASAMREAFLLRARLMPAIYAAVRECEAMTPLLRPMYLSRPTTERAYRTPHQYTLGEHLLCAPITTPGLGEACVASQYVWFPADRGDDGVPSAWHDLATGARYGGDPLTPEGAEAIVSAPIDRTPAFLRAGVPLAMQGPTLRMSAAAIADLRVRLFPGRAGQTETTELYEDDGVSLGYRSGRSATTSVTARWSAAPGGLLTARIDIAATTGSYEGQPTSRRIGIEVGAVDECVRALIDGVAAPADIDPLDAGGLLTIDLGERPIARPVAVELTFRPAQAAKLALRQRAADLASAIAEPVTPDTLAAVVIAHCADATPTMSPARIEAILRIGAGIGAFSEGRTLRVLNTVGLLDGPSLKAEIVDRVGPTESLLSAHTLAPTPAAPADLSLPAAELAAPPLGLRAKRVVRFQGSIRRVSIVFEHVLDTRLSPLTAFQCVGPFDWDWRWSIAERIHAPESFPIDPRAGYTAAGGRPAYWTPAQSSGKWAVNFRALWSGQAGGGGGGGGLAYAAIRINSPVAQPADIHFDSSDKLEASLDGVKVFSLDAFDSHAAAQAKATVSLPKGESILLIKASEGGGGWGFTASIDAQHPIEQRPL